MFATRAAAPRTEASLFIFAPESLLVNAWGVVMLTSVARKRAIADWKAKRM